MVTDIKKAQIELDIDTNGGTTMWNIKIKAKYLDYSKAWFDNKFIGNIYSFFELTDKYHITYNTKKYDE